MNRINNKSLDIEADQNKQCLENKAAYVDTGNRSAAFRSILFDHGSLEIENHEEPAFFSDLNLDQIINTVTYAKKEYQLKPFFYHPLHSIETIHYRQEIMRDMEDEQLMKTIKAFAEKMVIVRRYFGLSKTLTYNYHIKGWFLEAVLVYCNAVIALKDNLQLTQVKSQGFLAFTEYMNNYVNSYRFQSLSEDANKVKESLSGVKYSIIIQTGRFKVQKYEDEANYSEEVEKTFEKFKQGAVKSYLAKMDERTGMNHIETQILDYVSLLYPEQFAALDQFYEQHKDFLDTIICDFDREIQFYVAYLEFIAMFKTKDLVFCYPQVTADRHKLFAYDTFDLALACNLLANKTSVVVNDFYLEEPKRIIVVSGPNQGGKTTFARMFGQLHYLASLGCPVPGNGAKLFLYDQMYTHFEREEDIRNIRGKLQDDMIRIHHILQHATPDSILIMNEIFASTTLKDAVFLSKQIMAKAIDLDLLCVWVTFIDELSTLSEKNVSMISTVDPENPDIRTFKILRQPADGLAYALSIAKKHHLTYDQIKERMKL